MNKLNVLLRELRESFADTKRAMQLLKQPGYTFPVKTQQANEPKEKTPEEKFLADLKGTVKVVEKYTSYNRRKGGYITKERVFHGVYSDPGPKDKWDSRFILRGTKGAHYYGYVWGKKRYIRSPVFSAGKDFRGEIGDNVEVFKKPGRVTAAKFSSLIDFGKYV